MDRLTCAVAAVVVGGLLVGCAPSEAGPADVPGAADTAAAIATTTSISRESIDRVRVPGTDPAPATTPVPATDPPPAAEPPAVDSSTVESSTGTPAPEASSEPPVVPPPLTAPPASTAPPPETGAPERTPPSGAAAEPPPRLGRVATAVPTQGTTVVHVGWALDAPWTPLAAWTGTDWVPAEGGLPADSFGAVAIAGVGLGSPLTGFAYGGATAAVCAGDRQGPLLDSGGSAREFPGEGSYRAVGLAADWDIQPRGLRRSGFDSADYQRIGESIVAAAGVDPAGGDVTDVVRADLDGDGVEEVFVTFEKITDGGGAAGDFVVIYARYPTASGAVTDEVLFEHYPQAWTSRPTIGRAGVLAVADLNGDEIMEVALWRAYWDTALAELFVYDGATSLTSVAVSGCSL